MANTRYPDQPILILDDDPGIRARLALALDKAGMGNVVATDDAGYAARLMAMEKVELVLLDLSLPPISGEVLLRDFAHHYPQIPVIIVTGTVDPATIVRCMKAGAIDYIIKPVEDERLLAAVRNGLRLAELTREASGFRDRVFNDRIERPEIFSGIISADPRMIALFKYVEAVAKSRQPVLIHGETGTGKELFARAIHEASGRSGPFVALNIGGLDDTVLSDTLFGHRKGAYTGADRPRPGLIKEASGGSLFLDEIGDLDSRTQIKLLRLLQEEEYYPLGSDSPQRSETRIFAATARDLRAASRAGSFRADLYFRLQTHLIHIPPLRSRKGDLPLLAMRFIEASARSLGISPPVLPVEALGSLAAYDFPGNVRELESIIHDAVATAAAKGRTSLSLKLDARPGPESASRDRPQGGKADLEGAGALAPENAPKGGLSLLPGPFPSLRQVEAWLIDEAMKASAGNVQKAARLLGLSRQTLYKHLARPDKGSKE